jgi:hypothetical protein
MALKQETIRRYVEAVGPEKFIAVIDKQDFLATLSKEDVLQYLLAKLDPEQLKQMIDQISHKQPESH